MALAKIKSVSGTAVYLPGDDIDTDRIIPARFMKCVTFDGLGQYAFYDERKNEDGSDKAHPLNSEPFNKAPILLSGSNFGCGSSREHAPQSLYHWGFRAVVAESFAEIFFGNSTTLGIPCVTASKADIKQLGEHVRKNPETEITIDVEKLELRADGFTIKINLPDGAKRALTEGRWDMIGELLEGSEAASRVAAQV